MKAKPLTAVEAKEVMDALEKKHHHKCPPWCHKCPLMGGQVMPGDCWGCVDNNNLALCYCDKPTRHSSATGEESLSKRVAQLEKEVEYLMSKIPQSEKL